MSARKKYKNRERKARKRKAVEKREGEGAGASGTAKGSGEEDTMEHMEKAVHVDQGSPVGMIAAAGRRSRGRVRVRAGRRAARDSTGRRTPGSAARIASAMLGSTKQMPIARTAEEDSLRTEPAMMVKSSIAEDSARGCRRKSVGCFATSRMRVGGRSAATS